MQSEEGSRNPFPRVLGQVDRGIPGPTLILIGGLHGDEPSGPKAIRNLLDSLIMNGTPIRGRVFGLCGNVQALTRGVRFVDRDLNRAWTEKHLDELRAQSLDQDTAEDREQRELAAELHKLIEETDGPHIFLDLHTTSGKGPPFAFLCRSSPLWRIRTHFEIPIIRGVEGVLTGTLMNYMTGQGHIGLGFEGGQHLAPESVTHHEALIRIALVEWGLASASDVDLDRSRDILHRAVRGLPRVLRVIHRHEISPEDRFQMDPGFANLDPVTVEQKLAIDRSGQIVCPEQGRILLPLYQGLGEEGFLIVEPDE